MTNEFVPTFTSAVIAPPKPKRVVRSKAVLQRDGSRFDQPTLMRKYGSERSVIDRATRMEYTTNLKNTQKEQPAHGQQMQWISGDYQCLPEVPMFYPIERTSTVVNCSDPSQIAARIVTCLQKLSVAAKFNSQESSLFAETIDHTEFYVRLYKADNDGNQGVLVEVQRAEGDSYSYIKHARALLAAARGDDIDSVAPVKRRSASMPSVPSSFSTKKCAQREDVDIPAVEHVEELFQKDRIDAILLGMDSLLLLTDSQKSQASRSASDAVLQGNDIGHAIIKEFVLSLIRCLPAGGALSSREENRHDFASRQQGIMHNTALAVLGNSLQTALCVQCPKLCSIVGSEEWIGDSGIASILVTELSHANERAHDAYQAARCLNFLLATSSEVKTKLVELGLTSVMERSQSVGRRRHSLLARECEIALGTLASI